MKINRMIEMVTILLNKKAVTAKELAERFEVSTRTIYRDIEVLSGAGVPIYTNKGNGGGIALLDNYTLNKTLISDEESESLMLGLTTLKATNYPDIDKMLEKVSAVFKQHEPSDWVEVDFSPWGGHPNSGNKFDDIKHAILKRRVLEFDYVNAMHEKVKRQVEPIKLVFKSKDWYMWGFCRMRKGFRLFRISRMKDHQVMSETFERQPLKEAFNLQDVEEKARWNETPLRLRFQEAALYRIYDEFDDEYIHKNDDGTYDVVVEFPEGEWVYSYILSFGGDVKVIEPPHIREIIRKRLQEAVNGYND